MTAKVYYADLWGVREVYEEDAQGERVLAGGKYQWLWRHDIKTTKWTQLEPQAPFYFFSPQDADLRDEYEQGWKITDAMPVNVLGFQSHRDHFAIDFERETLRERINTLRDKSESDDRLRERFELGGWDIKKARHKLRQEDDTEAALIDCLYRPFDRRACYFSDIVMDRPRKELLSHVAGKENLCLNTVRQTKMGTWQHVVVSDTPAPAVYVELKDGSNLFPLYLYPNEKKAGLFAVDEPTDAPGGRRPNLAPEFVTDFAARLKMSFVADGKGDRVKTFGPEDVFSYMYAVFHAPAYRSRYSEFLKIDFPRLPLTSRPELFRRLCAHGSRLVALHLLEENAPQVATFPVAGSNTVEQVRYTAPGEGDSEEGRVFVNGEQYFAGVAPEVWNFHVGGYQVCQKWLKDRKGRTLSFDDLEHYRRVVAALAETISLMSEIDATIEAHGGFPLS
jgi:hypothetical protein